MGKILLISIMKGLSKLIIIIIFLLFSPFIEAGEIYALSPDNYLWLEFGQQIKEKNGSLTQPLFIYYGRFPDRKEDASQLEDLKAFYTLNEKDENGENIFYAVDIEKDKKASFIRINSLKTNQFTVLVEGEKGLGKVRYNYLAQTSFFVFGKSGLRREKMRPIPSDQIIKRLQIDVDPGYWPQTGIPFKGVFLFDRNPLAGGKIDIFDENENYVNIGTDKEGGFIYIPPDDQRLRRKGLTAYKQTILVGEQITENSVYKSSYSLLLHCSRFGNRNLLLGRSIFGGTIAAVFIVVLMRRRNFQP